MRWMLRSKIHQATVTQADLEYVGSITIDEELMEMVGLLPGERVLVAATLAAPGWRHTRFPARAAPRDLHEWRCGPLIKQAKKSSSWLRTGRQAGGVEADCPGAAQ